MLQCTLIASVPIIMVHANGQNYHKSSKTSIEQWFVFLCWMTPVRSAIPDGQQVVIYRKFVEGEDGESSNDLEVSEHPILKDKLYHFICQINWSAYNTDHKFWFSLRKHELSGSP